MHGFVTEPWHSLLVFFFWWLCALLSTCSISCWSLVFRSRHSCLVSGPVLVSCQGSDTHTPGLVLLWERAVTSLLGPCAPLSMCIHCLHFAFSCFVLFCVAHSLCFSLAACFHVCHVLCEHAACSCPVLNMASESVLLAMCLFFCCVWAHGFCHSFCVPCALMSIVLTPPILFPDYWLICPTYVISLHSSFAPFIISLCLQSCVSLLSKCCALPVCLSLRGSFCLLI